MEPRNRVGRFFSKIKQGRRVATYHENLAADYLSSSLRQLGCGWPLMGFMAPLVLLGVSLGMLGIEEAGVEIEDPFGLDPNHLPLDKICASIGRDLSDLTAGDEQTGVQR